MKKKLPKNNKRKPGGVGGLGAPSKMLGASKRKKRMDKSMPQSGDYGWSTAGGTRIQQL